LPPVHKNQSDYIKLKFNRKNFREQEKVNKWLNGWNEEDRDDDFSFLVIPGLTRNLKRREKQILTFVRKTRRERVRMTKRKHRENAFPLPSFRA
jgi:hypothetical protein